MKLDRDFYTTDGLTLAESLIGKVLVHRVNGVELAGVITETEAYMGITDKASHAYGGRRTARTETMYLEGGHAYVYLIYGMYSCMNITASTEGNPEAVLIRAVYPIAGEREMLDLVRARSRRKSIPDFDGITESELYSFTNGPGKLCNAMMIDRDLDALDMTGGDFFVRDDGYRAGEIMKYPRIGIDYAEEAKDYPWRFSVKLHKRIPTFFK
ncbi:MAG: DNA-3-methyladenine glycosylase [Ruminococcaceae bacterium]|nr:DNA-3-methyladenine glycosylase [Oscillospiraceae bacterium]